MAAPTRPLTLTMPADAAAARLLARARVAVATVVTLAVALAGDAPDAFLYVAGFWWVPAAGVLALLADDGGVRRTPLAGAVIDLVALAAAARLFEQHTPVILVALLVVVAVAAYTGGRAVGAAAVALAAVVAALSPAADHRLGGVAALLFVAGAASLVLLVDRAAAELQRAQGRTSRYRGRADAVLAHVAEAVVVTDASGMVVEHNPAASQLAGGDLRGRPCARALGLHEGERPLRCAGGCELLGRPPATELWITAGGERVPVLADAAAVVGDGGQVHEVVHSLRDITALKEADMAKTLFLATATHELKTPLTVIAGYLDLMGRTDVGADLRAEALDVMRRRTRELGQIIDRILLASRIDAGRLEVSVAAVDAGPAVAERVEALAEASGRAVTLEVAGDVPLVRADAKALGTVVDHLVDNALKYSPDGGEVRVSLAPAAGGAHLVVADHGIGMTADEAARCFDRFWRAGSAGGRVAGGTGIGLYIVRSLVEAMAGRVTVDSAPGAGTRFTVWLPAAVVEAAPVGAAAAPTAPAAAGEPSIVREFMRQIGIPGGGGA